MFVKKALLAGIVLATPLAANALGTLFINNVNQGTTVTGINVTGDGVYLTTSSSGTTASPTPTSTAVVASPTPPPHDGRLWRPALGRRARWGHQCQQPRQPGSDFAGPGNQGIPFHGDVGPGLLRAVQIGQPSRDLGRQQDCMDLAVPGFSGIHRDGRSRYACARRAGPKTRVCVSRSPRSAATVSSPRTRRTTSTSGTRRRQTRPVRPARRAPTATYIG
jgi:hypothetical protein